MVSPGFPSEVRERRKFVVEPPEEKERAPDLESASDERLVEAYLEVGDSAALERLIGRYQGFIAATCLRILRNRDDAADCAQEVVLKIVRSLKTYRGSGSFTTWIGQVTRSVCYTMLKKIRRQAEQPLAAKPELIESTGESVAPERLLEQQERTKTLLRRIARCLTEREWQVMFLHYVEGAPLHRVTEILQLSNPTGARAYVLSAKRKLRRSLSRASCTSMLSR